MYRFFGVIIIVLFSCNKNKEYINRQSDFNQAKAVVEEFYNKISSEDDFHILFSHKLQSKEVINDILRLSDSLGGNRENTYTNNWYTKVIEGDSPSSTYGIECYVIRSIINTQEIFELLKEGDSIKIINFRINLDIGNAVMPDVLREKYDK